MAFFIDVTEKLNSLYLEFQGKEKHVAQMIGSVKYFKAKKISHMKKASYTFQG
jgi:hypothetical protein